MSIRGVQQVDLLEPELAYIARLDGYVPKGITGSISAASSASFRRLLGITAFPENVPAAETVEIPGDGGVHAQYKRKAAGVITLPSAMAVFDEVTMSELKDETIYTEGSWKIRMRSRQCATFKNLAAIVSGRCISQEAGTVGEEGWYTIFYWKLTGQEQPLPLQIGGAVGAGIELSANETDATWWEEDLSTNYGKNTSWASNPIISDYPLMIDTYIGDGNASQTTTLSQTPAAANGTSVQAWENGTKQAYTTDYTVVVATKVVTHVTNPANGADYVFVYEYVPTC